MINSLLLLALFVYVGPKPGELSVHIPNSTAVDYVRMIARDKGYNVNDKDLFSVDALGTEERPFLKGYTSLAFYGNGQINIGVSINNRTGQAIDAVTCQIFDYPDLQPFQNELMRVTKTPKMSPQQLADDAGCDNPEVLTKPVPVDGIVP